jgi:excisionase family DNA binding protein
MTTQPALPDNAHVLTVDEAATLLRISRGLAFAAVRTGTLPHLRIGRRILIPRTALNTLLGLVDPPAEGSPAPIGHDHDAAALQDAASAPGRGQSPQWRSG